jgi:DNA-binding cell septation regulator SpoVG
MIAIKILEWRALPKNSLRGFVKIEMPSGMILSDVAVMVGERGSWASPPAKPMIGRDGAPLKDSAGKARYSPIVEFVSKDVRDRFSAAVIEALRAAHPDALS